MLSDGLDSTVVGKVVVVVAVVEISVIKTNMNSTIKKKFIMN